MFILIQIFFTTKLCLWEYTDHYNFRDMATKVKVWRYMMPFSYLQVEKAARNPDDKKIAQATYLNYKLWFTNGFNYLTDITTNKP